MFIVWGTRITRGRCGRVADFCPFCRGVTPCQLIRIGKVSHIYFISLGSGDELGYECECETCGEAFLTDVVRFHSTSQDRTLDVSALIQTTQPNIAQTYADRFALEQRVRTGQLTAKERGELIREPLLVVTPRLQARASSLHMDRRSGMSLLAMIALIVLGVICIESARTSDFWAGLIPVFFLLAGVAFVGLVISAATDARRFTRRKVISPVARALAPLSPSAAELEAELADLRQLGVRTGRWIKTQHLTERIAEELRSLHRETGFVPPPKSRPASTTTDRVAGQMRAGFGGQAPQASPFDGIPDRRHGRSPLVYILPVVLLVVVVGVVVGVMRNKKRERPASRPAARRVVVEIDPQAGQRKPAEPAKATSFRFVVDDVYVVRGAANKVILVGAVREGHVRPGQAVQIDSQFGKLIGVVEGIESMARTILSVAKKGDQVGLRVSGLQQQLLQPGDVVTCASRP